MAAIDNGRVMGQIIAVMPGSGGVGASLLGAAIAVRAAATHRSVVAVDLDPWSGGLDTVYGLEQEPGWRWGELEAVSGVVDGLELSRRLPATDGVAVLATSRAVGGGLPATWSEALPDIVAGLAATHDLVVLDLARDLRVLSAAVPLCHALLAVVGAQVAQLAAASVIVGQVKDLGAEPWAVLRGPRDLEDVEDLVRDHLGVPVLGRLGDDPKTAADLVVGRPPGARGRGPMVEIADRVLLRLVAEPAVAGQPAGTARRSA